jgi:hypothetical protein
MTGIFVIPHEKGLVYSPAPGGENFILPGIRTFVCGYPSRSRTPSPGVKNPQFRRSMPSPPLPDTKNP